MGELEIDLGLENNLFVPCNGPKKRVGGGGGGGGGGGIFFVQKMHVLC